MELGPHADDVRDIVDLVESGAIFRYPRPPLGAVRVIRDMAEAGKYVHVKDDDGKGVGLHWRELLEYGGEPGSDLISERLEREDAVPELRESLPELMDGAIDRALQRQFGDRYTWDDITFVWGTIDWIVRWRATFGRALPFIERLVEVYRLGGHPCGWVGRYPEGQLVAYFPPGDDTPENAPGDDKWPCGAGNPADCPSEGV